LSKLTVVGLVSHHSDRGLYLPFSDDVTLLQVTLAANNWGLEMGSISDRRLVANLVAVDNGVGFSSGNGADVVFSHLAIANNGTGMSLDTSNNFHFSGPLLVEGNSTSCAVAGTGSPGLTSACGNQGTSDADLIAATGIAADLVGKVSTDDAINPYDNAGQATCQFSPSPPQWQDFAYPLRGWGRDGGFPDPAERGRPIEGSTCRIWDYRLRTGGARSAGSAVDAPRSALRHPLGQRPPARVVRGAVEAHAAGTRSSPRRS
jgi:hypothetical protein